MSKTGKIILCTLFDMLVCFQVRSQAESRKPGLQHHNGPRPEKP